MKRAKPNRRTKTRGTPPFPTPILYYVEPGVGTETSISITIYSIGIIPTIVIPSAIGVTGMRSNVEYWNYNTGTFYCVANASVFDLFGTAFVRYEPSIALIPGNYTIRTVGLDPAVRGIDGQYMPAWIAQFSVL